MGTINPPPADYLICYSNKLLHVFPPSIARAEVATMAFPRFFVPLDADSLDRALREGTEVELPEKAAHHARRALRLRNGETVTVFAGTGREWQGEIRIERDAAWVKLNDSEEPLRESPVRMTLLQAFVSPEKLDWIIEKAVETGVTDVVLTPAARSVTRLSGERLEKRLEKCRDIARGAAEQCGRNVVPGIRAAKSLEEALKSVEADARLMLAPGAHNPAKLEKPMKKIAFAVGPEGGFSDEEIQLSADLGWSPVLLGPRVLRTETAGIAAAVWINTVLGDYPSL